MGAGVRELLALLEEAFEGPGIEASGESQGLMTNLSTVPESYWRARVSGAARTIESMVLHVGSCKVMYADYAFGDRKLQWGQPGVQPWEEGTAPIHEALDWLRETHSGFVQHIASLDDAELDVERMANWGEMRPTRWLVAAIIGHDFYHAGEVNHQRSLLSGDDRWLWQQQIDGVD